MNSVEKILNAIFSADSPIQKRDNESFSIPFISEINGKMCLTLFSYASNFGYGVKSGVTIVDEVFYINPNNISEYVVKDAKDIHLIDGSLALFSKNNEEIKKMPSIDKYRRLVELTDEIIADCGDNKRIVSEYANLFANTVSTELKPYYLTLGQDYFLWLNSLISQEEFQK